MKKPIYETSMLTNPRKGEHTVWTHYDDGTYDERIELRSPPVLDSLWVGDHVGEWSITDLSTPPQEMRVVGIDLDNKVIIVEKL